MVCKVRARPPSLPLSIMRQAAPRRSYRKPSTIESLDRKDEEQNVGRGIAVRKGVTGVAVMLHVTGRIETGRWAEFLGAVERWREFRRNRGWAVPRVFGPLAGEMNTAMLVFEYPDAGRFEQEDEAESADREYAAVAGAMPFDGPIEYRLFREALPPA